MLDDGEVIDTIPVNVSEVGERTLVSIRPERVEFNKERLHAGYAHRSRPKCWNSSIWVTSIRTRLRVAGNDDFHRQDTQRPRSAAPETR